MWSRFGSEPECYPDCLLASAKAEERQTCLTRPSGSPLERLSGAATRDEVAEQGLITWAVGDRRHGADGQHLVTGRKKQEVWGQDKGDCSQKWELRK